METKYVVIKDNTSSWKKLQDIWQGTIGHSVGSNKIETISIGCYRKVWSLDQSQESQVF